jgi:hypothetical protein
MFFPVEPIDSLFFLSIIEELPRKIVDFLKQFSAPQISPFSILFGSSPTSLLVSLLQGYMQQKFMNEHYKNSQQPDLRAASGLEFFFFFHLDSSQNILSL